jgi:hypothetical protein
MAPGPLVPRHVDGRGHDHDEDEKTHKQTESP